VLIPLISIALGAQVDLCWFTSWSFSEFVGFALEEPAGLTLWRQVCSGEKRID